MKSLNIRKQHDTLAIPEGRFKEDYTPQVGRIISPQLGKHLKYAKIYLSEDANVTYRSVGGSLITAEPLAKGAHAFLVIEVIAVSSGTVRILHDGVIDTAFQD